MKNQTQGFTLIELLIVIAIIGILAAVLIPNLLGARKRANDTVAKTYLSDAVKMQEMAQIDGNAYVDSGTSNVGGGSQGATQLLAKGLKPAPQDVTLTVVAANNVGYCMTTTHANGTPGVGGTGNKIFAATPARGIYEVTATNAVCTLGTTDSN